MSRFAAQVVAANPAAFESHFPAAAEVRRQVFLEEQQVPETLELDGLDPICRHVLVRNREEQAVVGCARLRPLIDVPGAAKVERVAVLFSFRGQGVGRLLMDTVEALAQAQGTMKLVVSAQEAVSAWYRRRGYRPVGGPYEEAGILHRKLEMAVRQQG